MYYRICLEIKEGPLGYTYFEEYYSKLYATKEEAALYGVDELKIPVSQFERRRHYYIQEFIKMD